MNTEYIYLLVDEVSIKGEITTSHHAFSTEKKAKQALADLKSHYDKIFAERGFLSDGVDEMNELVLMIPLKEMNIIISLTSKNCLLILN